MVGGDREVFEKIRPYFEPMGKQLYYCGGAGLGLQAKLTQNLILSNLMVAFNEGMVLATKGGVDPELMLEILRQQRRQIRSDRLQRPRSSCAATSRPISPPSGCTRTSD